MNDGELERQWRAHSTELPSRQLDESIRTSARRAMRRRPAWQRYVPLAAAASVGVIAFLLVRQTPSPAPIATTPAAPTAPAAPVVAENAAKRSREVTQEREQPAAMAAQVPAEAPARDEAPALAKALAPATAAESRAAPSSLAGADAVAGQAIDGLPPQIEALVKADAARRTGIEPEQVAIVAATAVTWPDGAIGCRRPGELAIQVLTPGYRVDVDAAGKHFVYHTDTHAQIRVCRTQEPDGSDRLHPRH